MGEGNAQGEAGKKVVHSLRPGRKQEVDRQISRTSDVGVEVSGEEKDTQGNLEYFDFKKE